MCLEIDIASSNHLQQATVLVELHSSCKTGDLRLILGVYISQHRVFSWWNLCWQRNLLLELQWSFLQWTLQVNVLHNITKICSLLDDRDQAVLDLQVYLGSIFYVLIKVTLSYDRQIVTAACMLAKRHIHFWGCSSRCWRVWVKIDLVDCQDVVLRSRVLTEHKWIVAGHFV